MANDKNCWVGFDLGGTKMLAVVYDHRFNQAGRARKKTKGAEGAEAGVARMIETFEEAVAEGKVDRKAIGGIGIAAPGPLDLDRGIILEAPNLGWKNVPLKDLLEKKLGAPVTIANDVDAGTYGEYRFGAGKKARCVVGVFPGTGIGGGCVYEGRVIRGRTASCMEIGHMLVQPSGGRLCGCGRRGCLETVASRLAIAADAAVAAFRGEAPYLFKTAGTDLADIRSGVLADAIKAGDSAVESIVRNAAKQIGLAVANVINLLAPDVVVMGGGLIEAMEDLFIDEIRKSVAKRAMSSLAKTASIVPAQLADDATVMGAAALAADAGAEKEAKG
jgi:glucokinase